MGGGGGSFAQTRTFSSFYPTAEEFSISGPAFSRLCNNGTGGRNADGNNRVVGWRTEGWWGEEGGLGGRGGG